MIRSRERAETEDVEKIKELESGYSEEEQAKDIESRSGDLHQMKRSAPAQSGISFDQGQSHAKEYQRVTEELGRLIEHYVKLIEHDLHQAQKLLDEIHKAQKMQHDLFERITGKK